MDVVSACRLPVASLVWQPKPSAWVLLVVCKATFLLSPGESPVAPDQELPNQLDDHWNGDATRSLRAPSDLVPMKARADVMLVGHAFAPSRQPVRSLTARLVVSEINKAIEVHCDRAFNLEGGLLEGQRFTRMPLVYERAAGGPDTANPVGVRPDVRDAYGQLPLPNLQLPGLQIVSPEDRIEPIGFGPIAPLWPARRERLGWHAAGWDAREWYRNPLPEDLDPAFFNAAPRDQQIAALRDGARLVLENLHHEFASLVTRLAPIRLRAVVEGRAGGPAPLAMHPDTLWVDTDRGLCTLTFRGHLALQHPGERGRVVVSREGQLAPDAPPPAPPSPAPGPRSLAMQTMMPGISAALSAALPFGNPAPAPRAEEARDQAGSGLPFLRSPALVPAEPPAMMRAPTEQPAVMRAPTEQSAVMRAPAEPPAMMRAPAEQSAVMRAPAEPPAMMRAPAEPPAVMRAPAEVPRTVGQLAMRAPEPEQADLRAAVLGGAGAASNAAAGRSERSVPTPEPSSPRAAPAPVAARPAARPEGEALELVWFEPAGVARIRRNPPWKRLLDELEQQALDADLDDPSLGGDPMETEERREVLEILARAEPSEAEGVHDALVAGLRPDGNFVAKLVLVAGELVFPFDELETLKATVSTVTPLVAGDENLKGILETARDFLGTPALLAAPAVAEGLTTRIKDAFAQGKRVVPPGYLEAQTERALLDRRHYQRRSIFKARHIRALMQLAGGAAPVPIYLPDELSSALPLYQRFGARVIAEVKLKADQYEAHPIALDALALLRVTQLPPRR